MRGRGSLEQQFRFTGDRANADAILDVLLTAPLVGEHSIFGNRPGEEEGTVDRSRRVRGFSPAPGFRFDVELAERDSTTVRGASSRGSAVVVRFTQPDRDVPYLEGELLWIVRDQLDGPVLDEQINTPTVLQDLGAPLGGPKRSLRRWLFFKVGHQRVMRRAVRNIAQILERRPG